MQSERPANPSCAAPFSALAIGEFADISLLLTGKVHFRSEPEDELAVLGGVEAYLDHITGSLHGVERSPR